MLSANRRQAAARMRSRLSAAASARATIRYLRLPLRCSAISLERDYSEMRTRVKRVAPSGGRPPSSSSVRAMDVVIAGGHGKIALHLEKLLADSGHRVS